MSPWIRASRAIERSLGAFDIRPDAGTVRRLRLGSIGADERGHCHWKAPVALPPAPCAPATRGWVPRPWSLSLPLLESVRPKSLVASSPRLWGERLLPRRVGRRAEAGTVQAGHAVRRVASRVGVRAVEPAFASQSLRLVVTLRAMRSYRFQRDVVVTRHASQRMDERGIDAGLLLQIIDTGSLRFSDETRLWAWLDVPGRDDNLLCAVLALEQVLVVKTVMHHFEVMP